MSKIFSYTIEDLQIILHKLPDELLIQIITSLDKGTLIKLCDTLSPHYYSKFKYWVDGEVFKNVQLNQTINGSSLKNWGYMREKKLNYNADENFMTFFDPTNRLLFDCQNHIERLKICTQQGKNLELTLKNYQKLKSLSVNYASSNLPQATNLHVLKDTNDYCRFVQLKSFECVSPHGNFFNGNSLKAKTLKTLKVHFNHKVGYLENINTHNFSNLENLFLASIIHNPEEKTLVGSVNIPSLKKLTIIGGLGTEWSYKSFSNLQHLTIKSNKINMKELLHLKRLKHLGIFSSKVCNIEAISYFRNLRDLNLRSVDTGKNHITFSNSTLKSFTYTCGGLEHFPTGSFPNLNYLCLDANKIFQLPNVVHMPSLAVLSVKNNELVDLEHLENFSFLRLLDVSENYIASIEKFNQARFVNLHSLILEDNVVTEIEPLKMLRSLRCLQLNGNDICDLSAILFLKHLKKISADRNRFNDHYKRQFASILDRRSIDHDFY